MQPNADAKAELDESELASRWGLKSGLVVGAYRLEKLLGDGGMGAVWQAHHVKLKKRVAIKTLKPVFATDATYVNRFIQEGQASARIQHPNAVDVTDVGVSDGMPYLVMEFLEGESLASKIQRDGPMKPKDVANIVIPVLCALSAAHKTGVVHRDVKPENIMLTRGRDGVLAPILVDFGISQLVTDNPRLTKTRTFLGTPHYMSPEQCNDAKNVDARTDVYSVGVLLYECLTARKPFMGESVMSLVRAICMSDYKPLAEARPNLPLELADLVQQAMHVERDQRVSTAAELAQQLIGYAGTKVRATYGPELGLGDASQIVGFNPSDTGKHRAIRDSNIGYADTVQGPAVPTPIGLIAPRYSDRPKTVKRVAWISVGLLVAALLGGAAVKLLAPDAESAVAPAQVAPAVLAPPRATAATAPFVPAVPPAAVTATDVVPNVVAAPTIDPVRDAPSEATPVVGGESSETTPASDSTTSHRRRRGRVFNVR